MPTSDNAGADSPHTLPSASDRAASALPFSHRKSVVCQALIISPAVFVILTFLFSAFQHLIVRAFAIPSSVSIAIEGWLLLFTFITSVLAMIGVGVGIEQSQRQPFYLFYSVPFMGALAVMLLGMLILAFHVVFMTVAVLYCVAILPVSLWGARKVRENYEAHNQAV